MKNIILIIAVSVLSTNAFAQNFVYGTKLGFGASSLKSKNMETFFNSQKSADHCVKKYSKEESMGFTYNVGAFAEYRLNTHFGLGGEVCFQSVSATIQTKYIQDQATRIIVKSENKFTLNSINIPLMAKYYFKESKGPFLLTGVALDLLVGSKLKVKEVTTYETYNNSGTYVSTQSTSDKNMTVKLDGASKFRASFLIGAGVLIPVKDKGVFVDARYSLPLTKSEVYSNDAGFNSAVHKSNPFGSEIAKNKTNNLNDFKLGVISINVGYRF